MPGLPISLPPLILLHACTLVGMGAYLFLLPLDPPARTNSAPPWLHQHFARPHLYYDVLRADRRESVPARFGPVALDDKCAVALKYWSERRSMSEEGKREVLWVVTYDGALSLILGWQLGRWAWSILLH
jgi:hypothetical protein